MTIIDTSCYSIKRQCVSTIDVSAEMAGIALDLGSTQVNLHQQAPANFMSILVVYVCMYVWCVFVSPKISGGSTLTFSKLVSFLETSGWIHSCSLEPMIAIRGLLREIEMYP